MIILKSLQKAMQVVGLLFTYSHKRVYRIYRWISFLILSSMIQPSVSFNNFFSSSTKFFVQKKIVYTQCLYLYVNHKDLIKATEMCVFVVAEAVMMAKVLFIIYNQKSVVLLLKDLQEIANESKDFFCSLNFYENSPSKIRQRFDCLEPNCSSDTIMKLNSSVNVLLECLALLVVFLSVVQLWRFSTENCRVHMLHICTVIHIKDCQLWSYYGFEIVKFSSNSFPVFHMISNVLQDMKLRTL